MQCHPEPAQRGAGPLNWKLRLLWSGNAWITWVRSLTVLAADRNDKWAGPKGYFLASSAQAS